MATGETPNGSYCRRLYQVYRVLASDRKVALPMWAETRLAGKDPRDAEEVLQKEPRLQAAMAAVVAYTPSKWLLEQELSLRESKCLQEPELGLQDSGANAESGPVEPRKSWTEADGDVYDAARNEQLRGLCFSGGGIRSATFCLGVMQALAKAGQLETFDYLSTVSGGGYIHQWLASWILNDGQGMAGVNAKLVLLPETGSTPRIAEQISWLRRYSSYLTPQRGLFTVDTWTMVAIWFRNTFLNQIVLFAALGTALMAARALSLSFEAAPLKGLTGGWVRLLGLLVFLWSVSAWVGLWRALRSIQLSAKNANKPPGALNNLQVAAWLVAPGFCLSLLVALESVGKFGTGEIFGCPMFRSLATLHVLGLTLAMTFGGQALAAFQDLRPNSRIMFFAFGKGVAASCVLCAMVFLGAARYSTRMVDGGEAGQRVTRLQRSTDRFASMLNRHVRPDSTTLAVHQVIDAGSGQVTTYDLNVSAAKMANVTPGLFNGADFFAMVAPVVFCFLQFLGIRLQMGVLGRFYSESRREWLARFGAWSAIACFGWLALGFIARVGPHLFHWLFSQSTTRMISAAAAAVAVHAVTLFSGASGQSDGRPKPGTVFGYKPLDLVAIVGAPLCILVLLVIASGLLDDFLISSRSNACFGGALTVGLCLVAAFFGWRVDVNEFSLHGFYRNRLARCYLGGNNPVRMPDPFTGFDEHNESQSQTGLSVSQLLPERFSSPAQAWVPTAPYSPGDRVVFGGRFYVALTCSTGCNPTTSGSDWGPVYTGPFPIFCTTLNLTFGEDLAWQERKGASFAFTPLYSGYHVGWTGEKDATGETTFNGFAKTLDYAYPDGGIKLAAAAAISGAAMNPNQGYNTQPAVSFLMTLFNVRLGWWLANPRKPKKWPATSMSPSPKFGLFYLMKELFGMADDTSNYVCLSDGGHFENMGLYELVRRRCSLLVICDAEQDVDTKLEGIGNAIAKCRTDFGAEIDLPLWNMIPVFNTDPSKCFSKVHFCTGTIRYPAPPAGGRSIYGGVVIYIKTSLVGDEPGDILHHKRAYPAFPQDSTLNQWFTESQFESYRRLGQLIGDEASRKFV